MDQATIGAEHRRRLERSARDLGFVRVGVTSVEPFPTARARGVAAVAAGLFDVLPWMSERRMIRSANPAWRFGWARSLVSLAWPYAPAPPPPRRRASHPRGRIGAYVATTPPAAETAVDYHRLIRDRLDRLVAELRIDIPDLRIKRFIDHGWAMDRAAAERAGVGFTGKNTCLITREAGSYVLLSELLLSVAMPQDLPVETNCGRCQSCLPACPTGALIAPGVIDARRCISALTIEHEGPIPIELRPQLGTWVFGCDLCQEACPINQRLAPGPDPAATELLHPDLVELLELSDDAFDQRYTGTAVLRSGRRRLARNAAIALGNAGDRAVLPALQRAAVGDADETVREAAAWAIERLDQEAIATSGPGPSASI